MPWRRKVKWAGVVHVSTFAGYYASSFGVVHHLDSVVNRPPEEHTNTTHLPQPSASCRCASFPSGEGVALALCRSSADWQSGELLNRLNQPDCMVVGYAIRGTMALQPAWPTNDVLLDEAEAYLPYRGLEPRAQGLWLLLLLCQLRRLASHVSWWLWLYFSYDLASR